MPRTSKLRVLMYDIQNDSWRRRVAYLLENEGARVQYSPSSQFGLCSILQQYKCGVVS